jgi:hypothetical protein
MMRHRRPLHEQAQCERPDGTPKTTYRSAAKARRAILKQRGRAGIPLYVYCCPKCELFHITSQPQTKGGN